MSPHKLLSFASVLAISTIGLAQGRSSNGMATQSTSTQVQQNTQAQMQGERAPAQAATATQVDAELKSAIDSKKAKTGDQVIAVTRSQAVLNNGATLPKGTTLLGHVTDASAYSKATGQGSVSFLFDQARMKDGNIVPIHAMVRSLKPSAMAASHMDSSTDMDAMAPTPNPALNAGAGASPAAGGVVGGAGRAVGGVTNGAVDSAGSMVGRTGRLANDTVGGVGSAAGNVSAAGTAGVDGSVMTAVPGVMLSGATGTSASGTVSTKGSNVRVESGTQMTVGVMSR
ncbi:hypothetical protein [Terriglobus tenax]|uniref:hypothetical protein n=1 Tax=Terriglobus tenax TaxID=1111115 RepID=UPI0021E0C4FD|nr:hypothetical protein [Terriglobus tenax]